MFSLIEHMPEHEFIPFCVDFSQNESTPYSSYFVRAPGGRDNVYFQNFNMSLYNKAKFALNMVYSFSARRRLEKLICDTKPDAALFLNAVYFSDSIIDACRRHKLPILWRLSDFNKICANYLLFRDGQICEACIENGLGEILKHKCGGYQKSYSAAVIKYLGMRLSQYRKIHGAIDYFITPSEFTRQKMIQVGYPPDQIRHIPTFIVPNVLTNPSKPEPKGILYVGRLSPEKGVDHLIDAFGKMKTQDAILTIAGDTNGSYAKGLIDSVPIHARTRVHFTGFQSTKEVSELFLKNLFFIVPSVWYENQPNVVLEGMASSRAALVSKLGSLEEMVDDGRTGYHFKAANAEDLANKMDYLIDHPDQALEMGAKAQQYVQKNHTLEKHLVALNDLLDSVVRPN